MGHNSIVAYRFFNNKPHENKQRGLPWRVFKQEYK